MSNERKAAVLVLSLIFFIFFGLSLIINIPSIQQNFLFADEATYYSMTQSLAHDRDLEYTKRDLIRFYRDFDSGPMGLFLKKGKDSKIFFAKSYAYPVFAAPFYRVFGKNGFFVFHSLLLYVMLLMGVSIVSIGNRPALSLFITVTFLFASIAVVYFFWISPDFFNLFLTFTILYLWFYKKKAAEKPDNIRPSPWQNFLMSDSSDYAACILAGIAVFSKPPNIVLVALILLAALKDKKYVKTVGMLGVFLITSALFWGANFRSTGEWNYQGGERKIFHYNYPFAKEQMTFDNLGQKMTSEGYGEKHFMRPGIIARNIFYYFAGRYTGLAWYFTPALIALFLFFSEKKRFDSWLLFGALAAEVLIYIIFMPDNYAGGGGALSNRYFLCIYPVFFFLAASSKKLKFIGFSWLAAGVFIAQILISPVAHSRFPATHAKHFPFTMIPPELTLINNLPTDTNPAAKMIKVGLPPNTGYIHHLDDNFIPKPRKSREKENQAVEKGIWTKGTGTAEMILETHFAVKEMIVHLHNNARRINTLSVHMGRKKKKIILGRYEKGILSFHPGRGFVMRGKHLYILKITSAKSSIPFYESKESRDKRILGAYFELELIPALDKIT